MQLCATVSNFEELEHMNDGVKIDGLVLIVSYTFNGSFRVTIQMPQSFEVSR